MARTFTLRFNANGKCMLCGQGRFEDPDKRMVSLIEPATCHIILILCNDCIDEKLAETFEDNSPLDINL